MSKPIPPELVELILDLIPLNEDWSSILPSDTLFACCLVSRLFCHAARRRLFSTLFIAPAASLPKTRAKFKALVKLFEEHSEVLLSTRTVQINLDYVKSRKWAFSNDGLLSRILTMIKTRQRKLDCLRIKCARVPDFDEVFGPRTKKAIMDLIPDIQSLTLEDMVVPATFLEKLPPLKYLHARNFCPAPEAITSHVPPQFTIFSDVSIDLVSLGKVYLFYQRSKQLQPAYVNLIIDSVSPLRSSISLNSSLSGSADSLRILTLLPEYPMSSNQLQLELGRFKRLTSIRIKYDAYIFQSTWRVLGALKTWLTVATSLLTSTLSPSSLVNVEIEIYCLDPVVKMGDIETTIEALASMQPIDGLLPNNLVKLHPQLKSIQTKIASSQIDEVEDHLAPTFRSTIGRCIQKLLPNSLPMSNADKNAVVYNMPLDQL